MMWSDFVLGVVWCLPYVVVFIVGALVGLWNA